MGIQYERTVGVQNAQEHPRGPVLLDSHTDLAPASFSRG
jgi:hypothetical protein